MAGPKTILPPPPFKADIVLKTVFGRAKRYNFHPLAGFGRPLANWLDPPVPLADPGAANRAKVSQKPFLAGTKAILDAPFQN